jgi:hypothetical protein
MAGPDSQARSPTEDQRALGEAVGEREDLSAHEALIEMAE